jgi:regulator of replication initiation timing
MIYTAGQIVLWMALATALGALVGWLLQGIRQRRLAAERAMLAASTATHRSSAVGRSNDRRALLPPTGQPSAPPAGTAASGPEPAPLLDGARAASALPPTIAQLTADLAVANDANDLQRQKLVALEQKLQAQAARYEHLESEYADTNDELDALRKSIGPRAAEMERLRRENDRLRHTVESDTKRLAATRRYVDELVMDHGLVSQRLEQVRRYLGADDDSPVPVERPITFDPAGGGA